jgi:EAL domain-containing protein (putative c-di-GMP-specific phosphodiesterase class I)
MTANRLLILDDDPGALHFLAEVGRRCRFDVALAESSADFRDAYERFDPTLLLLDLRYDRGDGIDVMAYLGRQECRARIILVSGVDARTLEAARRIGLNHGLAIVGTTEKPTPFDVLESLLLTHREPEAAEWSAELQRAIDLDELTVFYQPKARVADGHLVGFEALARWFHPTRGEISPEHFIQVAEVTGQIAPLTYRVLSRAITDHAIWAEAGHRLTVAVNISAMMLRRDDFVDTLCDLVEQHRMPPECLILEITESIAIRSPSLAMEMLSRLRLRGFHVALDDFGAGYSNLSVLARLPIDELKLDRSILKAANESRHGRTIVGAIAQLARELGLRTVAEGIEDFQRGGWLADVGIDQAQGYGIAAPMPSSEVLTWIDRRPSPWIGGQDRLCL